MSCGIKVPGAAEPFFVDTVAADTIWYHVYSTESHANTAYTFAEGWGDTRFAPIKDVTGAAVHTYYAASEPDVAYMESVLHDAALSPPGVFEVTSLVHYHLATIRLPKLEFASFHTPYLPALGLTRAEQPHYLLSRDAPLVSGGVSAVFVRTGCRLRLSPSRRGSMPDAVRAAHATQPRDGVPLRVGCRRAAGSGPAAGPRRAEVLRLIRSLHIREI